MESASDGQNTKFNFDLNDEPSADLLAPNVLIEVNVDMFDPLAMPDPSLVDPIDVQTNPELINNEPLTIEDSMTTEDPFNNVSNLMISSMVIGNDLVGSIGTDIEIEPTKLSSDPNNTRSLKKQGSKGEKKSDSEKTRERKTRKVLSLDLKLSIIKMYGEGASNTEIARDKGEFLRDILSKSLLVYFSLSPFSSFLGE